MAKRILILLLLPLMGISQTKSNELNETIYFKFEISNYNKVAKDNISQMYNQQLRLSKSKFNDKYELISNLYKLDDLSLNIIPNFRLKRDASKYFTCDSSIEKFIQFEERHKYMQVLVNHKNEAIQLVTIPNIQFEIERVSNPDIGTVIDRSRYEMILRLFLNSPKHYERYTKIMQERKKNFFFNLYGMTDVLFEIDNETGLIYANTMDFEPFLRMNANEYIRKYVGETIVREFGRGYYDDIDGTGSLIANPCIDNESPAQNVIVRLKK